MNVHVSPTDLVQADRILRVETPLGADQVLPERFELSEGIGGFEAEESVRTDERGLFAGRIAVRSPRHDLAADELVGRYVDVSLELSAKPPVRRTWHCLVSELLVGPPVTRGMRSYRLTLRPPHWLLTRKKDCRIWQKVSSVDVVRTLLSEHGLAAPVMSGVINEPPPQAYSVQYNESDWSYACRRLEQDGIAWWTAHSGGGKDAVLATCDLHLASYVSGYTQCPYDNGRVRYSAGSTDRNHITRFDTAFRFVPGSRAGADWNFLTPGTVPGADDSIPSHVQLPGGALGSNADYESYEYPSVGGYGTGAGPDGASEGIDAAELDRLERLRAQAHEADHAQVVGKGTVRTLAPGQRFTPYDVPAEQGLAELLGSASDGATDFAEHVVLSITHRAVDQSYESQGGAPEYGCTFTALPAATPATPHRNTPRPRIDGQQIAIVAGPDGEEIHTDKYGRVKLWFPWDRRAAKDGTDTCWVRVAQSWSGGGWGAQFIPRIGMEAVVSYLDGDPDRPLVTGLVPNPAMKTPYTLPGHKTKTVIRSNSHKTEGFNELSFEDQTGVENMFLHAQKDQTTKVLNNQTSRVDANALHSVGANQSLEVGSNMSQQVGGGMNVVVGGVGSMANAIAGGLLAGLSAASGSMLGQAMGIVRQAAADAPSPADRNAQAAAAAGGSDGGESGSAGSGDGSNGANAGFTATDAVNDANTATLAAGALGAISGAFDGVRSGVNDAEAPGMRSEGGASMASAGASLSSQVGGMIGKGILNTLVSRMQNTSVGVAKSEQVGVAKVVSVGQVFSEMVGKTKRISIGEELYVGVGGGKDKDGNDIPPASILIMKSDGTILLKGVKVYVDGESHVQVTSAMIDHN